MQTSFRTEHCNVSFNLGFIFKASKMDNIVDLYIKSSKEHCGISIFSERTLLPTYFKWKHIHWYYGGHKSWWYLYLIISSHDNRLNISDSPINIRCWFRWKNMMKCWYAVNWRLTNRMVCLITHLVTIVHANVSVFNGAMPWADVQLITKIEKSRIQFTDHKILWWPDFSVLMTGQNFALSPHFES